MALRIGLHAPVQGATQRFNDTAAAIQAAAFLWLDAEQVSDALAYPDALHVLRIANWRADQDANDYAQRMAPRIAAWQGVPNLVVQCGNESNLESGHDGERFPEIAAALRAAFPAIQLANPPLSVEATARLRPESIQAADYVCCHSYIDWQHPETLAMEQFGQSYRLALAAAQGKRVIVTEAGVSNFDGMNWPGRNRLLAQWLSQAAADGVHAATLYIADGIGTQWASFDIGPEAGKAIRSLITPPEQPVNPYAYDGPYDFATWTRMLSGPLTDKNPSAASFANYRAAIAQGEAVGVSLPTLAGWIKSENVDPDLVAVNNLAGIEFVGQSRAYRSEAHFPPNEDPAQTRRYAGFRTPDDFWYTLAVNIATIDPDAWQRGDLSSIARTYTGGDWGLAKVALVDALRDTSVYPHGAVTERDPGDGPAQQYRFIYPVDADIIQGSDGTFSHGGKSPGFFALDYGCAFGTPIRCVADGTVIYNGFNHPREGQTGHTICVQHPGGYESRYCHLSAYPAQVGDAVRQGEIIATSGAPDYPYPGANGYGSGAHLHFSISLNDAWVRCEDLMAAGLMGPYDASEEETDMHVDGKFDPGRLARLWDGPKTKAQIKTVGGYSDQRGIDARWLAELQAGKPVGFATSKEESMPTGGVIRYFSNGFICSYPDGSTTVC